MVQRRAIFLDRDGVINHNRPDYIKTWDEFVFLPHALEGLKLIAATGWTTIVITNQSAIGRGIITEAAVRGIHARMIAEAERAGGCIHAVYFCPHKPEDNCACRKPRIGMYLEARSAFGIDLARSYVIGDTVSDVAAAQAIGAQPILVLTGLDGKDQLRLVEENHPGYVVADDLLSAVEWIYQTENLPGKALPKLTRRLDRDLTPR